MRYSRVLKNLVQIQVIIDQMMPSQGTVTIDDVGGGNGTVALAKTGAHNWTELWTMNYFMLYP